MKKRSILLTLALVAIVLVAAAWLPARAPAAASATWGQYVVTQAGMSQGVVIIAMAPVSAAGRSGTYIVAGSNEVQAQVLSVALTALSAGRTVAAMVDPNTLPYPTIYGLLAQALPAPE